MDRLLSYFTFKTKKQFQQKQENHSKTTIIDSSQPFLEKNKTQMFWKKKRMLAKKIIILSGKHPSRSELMQTVHLVSLHFMSIFHYLNCHICSIVIFVLQKI